MNNTFLATILPQLSPLAAKSLRQTWRSLSQQEQDLFSPMDYDGIYRSLSAILPNYISYFAWSKLNTNERLQCLANVIIQLTKDVSALQRVQENLVLNLDTTPVISPDSLARYKSKLLERFQEEKISSTILRGFYQKEFFLSLPSELRKAICEVILEYCQQQKIVPEPLWVDLAFKMGFFS